MRRLALSLLLLASCRDKGSDSGPSPAELSFPGVGAKGVFDPSLEADVDGRLWMSYSDVDDSPMWPGRNDHVRTRLAWSGDAGASWTDAGIVNAATDVVLPLAPPLEAGTWNHEVPALVRDPGAPAAERWKLLWHRYLWINGVRRFEHGWIAMRTAPAPTGPWSSERKLFAGSLYDASHGALERRLDTLHPELAGCVAASEPGALASADALYVVLLAAEGTSKNGRVALLRWRHASPGWEYRGSFLVNAVHGPAAGVDGFSAPELFMKGPTPHLIVTPQIGDRYLGAHVYRVTDLDAAAIEAAPALRVFGAPGSHHGAAGYDAGATACGLLYSEAALTPPVRFRIMKSGILP